MTCVTCGCLEMDKLEQSTFWCSVCGTIADRGGEGHESPTQARSHAALRKAAGTSQNFVRHALEFFNWSAFPHLRGEVEKLAGKLDAALALDGGTPCP